MALKLKLLLGDELKQKQAIRDNLINKILYSKRLLVDHVEALEHCLLYLQNENVEKEEDTLDSAKAKNISSCRNNKNNINSNKQKGYEICTARNTFLLVGSTIFESYIIPRQFRLLLWPSMILSTGISSLYMIKKIFVFRNKLVEREVENLIKAIDEFGNCIRRNMTYFNEILIIKQQELVETCQIERAWDCITATKEVTEILYDATRKLEMHYPLPAKFKQYYSPMEELRECEYFKNNITDYSPKHLKDFHNIFAYVQSQFLLRLALTVLTKPSISVLSSKLKKMNCLIKQLVQEEETHFRNLAIEINEKKQMEIDEINATQIMQNRSGPVAVLQDSSLKLSSRMVAVAGECQQLDITLQRLGAIEISSKDNGTHLLQVAQNMRSIEGALSVCFEDFQRLMLVYSKFLNSRLDALDAQSPATDNAQAQDLAKNSMIPGDISNNDLQQQDHENTQKSDDFFAYMYDEREAQLEQASRASDNPQLQEREILNFEKRLTKGKFRPVLNQLKDRIDPIRQVMLEKEREVLAAKGLNVDEFLDEKSKEQTSAESFDNNNDYDDNNSEDSADLEYERQKNKLRDIKNDQYEEMRKFLSQKQAINLFKLDLKHTTTTTLPPTPLLKEDLLESEC